MVCIAPLANTPRRLTSGALGIKIVSKRLSEIHIVIHSVGAMRRPYLPMNHRGQNCTTSHKGRVEICNVDRWEGANFRNAVSKLRLRPYTASLSLSLAEVMQDSLDLIRFVSCRPRPRKAVTSLAAQIMALDLSSFTYIALVSFVRNSKGCQSSNWILAGAKSISRFEISSL